MHYAVLIHLVGPGGAGKSTVGPALARRLGVACIDLDDQFRARAGDITAYLNANEYRSYAERNVRVYLDGSARLREDAVIASSSGLVTYSHLGSGAYVKKPAERLAGLFLSLARSKSRRTRAGRTRIMQEPLIAGPAGYNVLDAGYPTTARMIMGSIAKLGFDIKDVKSTNCAMPASSPNTWVLLNSEPHPDHGGGLAVLQQASGARWPPTTAARVAVFVMLCALLPANAVHGGNALPLRVNPAVALAPAFVIVRATVEKHEENRFLEVSAESDRYFDSSQVPLMGLSAPADQRGPVRRSSRGALRGHRQPQRSARPACGCDQHHPRLGRSRALRRERPRS